MKDFTKEELEQIGFGLENRDYDLKGLRHDAHKEKRFNEIAHIERELDAIETASKKVYKIYTDRYPQREIR